MSKLTFFLLILFFLTGCRNYKKQELQLLSDTLITELSDSSLFSNNINGISLISDKICFADYVEGNIVVLDDNLCLQYKVGKHGNGPDEIVGVTHFVGDESSFYLLDEGSRSIKEFSLSGTFLSRINIPDNVVYAPWARFIYFDSLFYLPNIKGSVASVINRQGQIVKLFGRESGEVGGKILLLDKNHIWAIGMTSPVIEKYSKDGLLVDSLIYRDIPIVEEIIRKKKNTENSFMAIVNDACLSNGKLYLLLAHKVLCISIAGKIQLETTFLLPHGFYNSISVEKNKLYSINIRNMSIEKFTIPDD